MAISFAGDTLDGHPPANTRPAPGVILTLIAWTIATATGAIAWCRARPGVLVDVACFAAITAGVFLLLGPGAGLIAAGVSGLVVKDFGDGATAGS